MKIIGMISPNYEGEGTGGAGDGGAGAGGAWYGTPDTETLGYIQSRGLDKMKPEEAAMASIKAHREAEKLIGVPPDQLLRFPKDLSDVEGWNKIHAKLGVPADAKEYDFASVKNKAGETLNEDVANTMRTLVAELKIPKGTASILVQKIVDLADKSSEESMARAAGELAQEQAKLDANWGSNKVANQTVADNALRALGVTEEQKDALKGSIGYAATMELFRNIGARMGEGNFIDGGNNQKGPAMTVEAAQYRLDQLQNDAEWFKRFQAGGAVENKEFNELTAMASGRK